MHEKLWRMLPVGIERCVGVGKLAEMTGVPSSRVLDQLRELEPRGARYTTGEVVNGICRFNHWYREGRRVVIRAAT